MEELKQEIIDRLIATFLVGKITDEEISVLENWIQSSAENQKYFHQVKNIWEATGSITTISQIDTPKSLEKTMRRINSGRGSKRIIWILQRAAAILLLPLILGGYYLGQYRMLKKEEKNIAFHEVVASYGSRSSIILADGTQVWLNSGTHLKYPDKFVGNERLVFLDGEAYFSVKSDKEHPFYVETNKLRVKATGTQFNVMSYADSPDIQVTLVEGDVDVLKSGSNEKEYIIGSLKPNQQLSYNTTTSKVIVKLEDIYKYVAWKDGKLIFRNEPLTEVVKVINRLYNVEIVIQDKSLEDYRYRATFQGESLSDILYLLKMSSPIQFREAGSKALPDGSFSKRKILIYKK